LIDDYTCLIRLDVVSRQYQRGAACASIRRHRDGLSDCLALGRDLGLQLVQFPVDPVTSERVPVGGEEAMLEGMQSGGRWGSAAWAAVIRMRDPPERIQRVVAANVSGSDVFEKL
jgi:hypothetical protein